MNRAFTLVELLASLALLALVILLGAAIVNSASSVSRTTVQRTELREEARSVFDRMKFDFATAVRFNSYEIRTSSSTNSVISLLSNSGRSGSTRLQRIDYHVGTNGLIRSVQNVGWDGSQDISSIAEGTGEVLSQAVGQMVAQTVMSDGTLNGSIDNPSARVNPKPAGIMIWLALANPGQRRNRNLASPNLVISSSSPWVQLDATSEREGWRLSSKTLRLP